ncbi:MAG: hypothetical protein AAB493_02175 [Patescibacteria group bacterium]|mgnify:CR=1 FL=1
MITEHLDKNNLHHAYLIEGMHNEIIPEIFKFMKEIKVKTIGNPDFCHMSFNSFTVEDARNLKSKSSERGFSSEKKVYVISINNFLSEAQNTLLKMFEEPIEHTHFFLIVPDVNSLLKTLVSRFYLISPKFDLGEKTKEAEKFILMPIKDRISFLKDLLAEEDEYDEFSLVNANTPRLKALNFLNALEITLHNKYFKIETKTIENLTFFNQIFKAREFLRMPGSSAKSLMESVALSVPNF